MTHTKPGEQAGEPHISRSLLRRGAAAAVALVFLLPMAGRAEVNWEEGFRNPPAEYRPEVYWDWMGGLISKAGITKDLEALERAGVGGVLIMQMPDQLAGVTQWRYRDYLGKVRCLSEEWFGMMNHAAKECDRLGLRMSFLMCPGWKPLRRALDKAGEGFEAPGGFAHPGHRPLPLRGRVAARSDL